VFRRKAEWAALALALFAFAIRVRGIDQHFWLLGDQIRDWGIALRPISELPLVGPATHVGGYTIGPAYYWIMWVVRITVGPWFDNLPHAGGYGQAAIESAADALLVVAVWRRTRSGWVALATGLVIITASFDLALSAIDWTPPIASALVKAAVALILLDWQRTSVWRAAVIAALAWCALQVYTGAVFVTAGVFAALLVRPLADRDWPGLRRRVLALVAVVFALQVPYLVHRLRPSSGAAMGAVTGGVWRVLSGQAPPEIAKSLTGFAGAFNYIEVEPWHTPLPLIALAVCCAVVLIRYRHDRPVQAVTVLPLLLAIAGYALFLDTLDHYYYIPVMPVAVLTMSMAMAVPARDRLGHAIGVVLCVAAAGLVPSRLAFAATMHRLPEYHVLVDASRAIVGAHRSVRSIRTEFELPPSTEPDFVYRILGGRIDATAPQSASIAATGDVTYVTASPPASRPPGPR
jgi:hypothetical protein